MVFNFKIMLFKSLLSFLDNFNVISINSKHNYFTNYSIQGRAHPRSYMAQVKKGNTVYSFLGVDACLEPGNFYCGYSIFGFVFIQLVSNSKEYFKVSKNIYFGNKAYVPKI